MSNEEIKSDAAVEPAKVVPQAPGVQVPAGPKVPGVNVLTGEKVNHEDEGQPKAAAQAPAVTNDTTASETVEHVDPMQPVSRG